MDEDHSKKRKFVHSLTKDPGSIDIHSASQVGLRSSLQLPNIHAFRMKKTRNKESSNTLWSMSNIESTWDMHPIEEEVNLDDQPDNLWESNQFSKSQTPFSEENRVGDKKGKHLNS